MAVFVGVAAAAAAAALRRTGRTFAAVVVVVSVWKILTRRCVVNSSVGDAVHALEHVYRGNFCLTLGPVGLWHSGK